MSARETLDAMRTIEQAATEGPWVRDTLYGYKVVTPNGSYGWQTVGHVDPPEAARPYRLQGVIESCNASNGDFIAAARSFVPKAIAALDAVLALIRARTRTPAEDGSVDEYDYVGELADDILAAIEQALS